MPIISPNIRVRCPDHFEIGENSIVDDYCYFSTRVRVGDWSHIAPNVTVAGGSEHLFALGDHSALASGARIFCASHNYTRDLLGVIPLEIKEAQICGDVVFGHHSVVGANAVVMPNQNVPDGCAIGALSFVPSGFEFVPWSVYAGAPIRLIKRRDRDSVLRQTEKLLAMTGSRE